MTVVLPVLMYHSVPASGLGDRLAVPRSMVDRQWRALRADGWDLRGLPRRSLLPTLTLAPVLSASRLTTDTRTS